MIYTELTKKAMVLCYKAHEGQMDKGGAPYVFHPFHIAEQMKTEDATVVALLHDVLEDSFYSLEDLKSLGFSDAVCDAVDLMTHKKDMPYMEYIQKIKENPLARAVKLCDLLHNSDITRLDAVREKDLRRIEKYKQAISVLKSETDRERTPLEMARTRHQENLLNPPCKDCSKSERVDGILYCSVSGKIILPRYEIISCCNGRRYLEYKTCSHFVDKSKFVKVVRCRDCKYMKQAKPNKKGFLICPASGMEITENDFCSYGEKK